MGWWKERLPFLLIYICVGDPLDWEQNSGAGPGARVQLQYMVPACGVGELKFCGKSETVLEVQRSAGCMHALGVCHGHC